MNEATHDNSEKSQRKQQGRRELLSYLSGIGLGLLLTMTASGKRNNSKQTDRKQQERHEFFTYVWGIGLALVLTWTAFALVQWTSVPRHTLFIVIGVLALAQMIVHFRFFLHIGFQRKREDLQLILFSALLLLILVGGTIWIMTSLAARMTLQGG